jgi:hypothetical protein
MHQSVPAVQRDALTSAPAFNDAFNHRRLQTVVDVSARPSL